MTMQQQQQMSEEYEQMLIDALDNLYKGELTPTDLSIIRHATGLTTYTPLYKSTKVTS